MSLLSGILSPITNTIPGLSGLASTPTASAAQAAGANPYVLSAPGIPGATPLTALSGGLGNMDPTSAMAMDPTGAISGAPNSIAPINLGGTKAVKAALKELGFFRGAVNSKKSKSYRRSILAFQKKNGLRRTGKMNAETRQAIRTHLEKRQSAMVGGTIDGMIPGVTGSPYDRLMTGAPASGAALLGATPQVLNQPGSMGMPGMSLNPGIQSLQGLQGLQGLQALPGMNGAQTLPFTNPGVVGPSIMPQGSFSTGSPFTGGDPQMNATNQQGIGSSANGATQNVTNRNQFDSGQQGFTSQPFYGGYPSVGWGGFAAPYATPWAAPGASMTGQYYLQPQQSSGGFLSSLLNSL